MNKWINCRDRLPEEDEDYTQYLLFMYNGRMAVGFVAYPFSNETLPQWYGENDAEYDHSEVTHWAVLPELPK